MKVLIVDDNDRYANNLKAFFDIKKIASKRAIDAKEGWEMFQKESFHTVVGMFPSLLGYSANHQISGH